MNRNNLTVKIRHEQDSWDGNTAQSSLYYDLVTGNQGPGVALTGLAFTDNLPAGSVVASTPAVSNTCGGTVTAAASSSSVALSGATLVAGALCKVSVDVTGTASGVLTNSVQATSTEGGAGNTASANLNVASPPSIVKAFGAATIPLNTSTSLTFNITSPNTVATLTGIAFTDNLPAGLTVANPNGWSSTCVGTPTAVAGSGVVSLTGVTLAPGANCTATVNVTGTIAGVKSNSVQVTSIEGGTGNTSTANITVVEPPLISKSFGAASIPLNGLTALSFTLQNNNTTVGLTGVAFTDVLPTGLTLPGSGTGTICGGGTLTITAPTGIISLSGAALAASTSCAFTVNPTGSSAGQQNNITSVVSSLEGGTGGTASASIAVVAPPVIAKAFSPTTIALNGTTTLTLTVTNPAANSVAQTGVAFTDTLPAGLVVATPNNLSSNCGGVQTAVAGSGSISLTGGTIATNTSCTVVVNVLGAAPNQYTNTTGAVTSTNGGTGNTASANLTVAAPPSIVKAFGAATIPLSGSTSLTFTITNPNSFVALTGLPSRTACRRD